MKSGGAAGPRSTDEAAAADPLDVAGTSGVADPAVAVRSGDEETDRVPDTEGEPHAAMSSAAVAIAVTASAAGPVSAALDVNLRHILISPVSA